MLRYCYIINSNGQIRFRRKVFTQHTLAIYCLHKQKSIIIESPKKVSSLAIVRNSNICMELIILRKQICT